MASVESLENAEHCTGTFNNQDVQMIENTPLNQSLKEDISWSVSYPLPQRPILSS
jgi:hypothetical protein